MTDELTKDAKLVAAGKRVRKTRSDKNATLKKCPMFQDIHDMLVEGAPISQVREGIRSRKYFRKKTDKAIDMMLEHYKATINPVEVAKYHKPLILHRAEAKINSAAQIVADIQEKWKYADDRAEWDYQREKMLQEAGIDQETINTLYRVEGVLKTAKESPDQRIRFIDQITKSQLLKLLAEKLASEGGKGNEAVRRLIRRLGEDDFKVLENEESRQKLAEEVEAVTQVPQDMMKTIIQRNKALFLGDEEGDKKKNGKKNGKKS